MFPFTSFVIEAIKGEKLPSLCRNIPNSMGDVQNFFLCQKVWKAQTAKTRAQIFVLLDARSLKPLGRAVINAQQCLPVRPGTLATAPALDSIQIIQQGANVIVVKKTLFASTLDQKRQNW